jgi:hypothetical protein
LIMQNEGTTCDFIGGMDAISVWFVVPTGGGETAGSSAGQGGGAHAGGQAIATTWVGGQAVRGSCNCGDIVVTGSPWRETGADLFQLVADNSSQSWTTMDFVKHYYVGGGETVYLNKVGLARAFRRSKSVRAATSKFIAKVIDAGAWQRQSESAITDVTSEKNLFALGHSQLFMWGACSGWGCDFEFQIHDWFRDPLGVGIETGGIPYRIEDQWTVGVSVLLDPYFAIP